MYVFVSHSMAEVSKYSLLTIRVSSEYLNEWSSKIQVIYKLFKKDYQYILQKQEFSLSQ